MIITLKDGSTKEYSEPKSIIEIAADISEGLARMACAGEVNGEVEDLRTVIDKDCNLSILTFNDEGGKAAFRHTTSHIMAQAIKRLYPETKLAIGPSIADGFYYDVDRETPLTSEDLEKIEAEMKKIGVGEIATVSGRYYAMDRDNRWDRVELAYNALTSGEGVKGTDAPAAVQASYDNDKTDEFVLPTVIEKDGQPTGVVSDKDSVVFFNFRPDRAREITRAFCDDDFQGFERKARPQVTFVCFTDYDDTIQNKQVAFHKVQLHNTFGEYLAAHNMTQARIAETEKYAHVTFFFNGGVEEPNKGEDRILVKSPKVATYDLQPEMSAPQVCEKLVDAIKSDKYDVIVINFANPDMVGHTGVQEAAIKAVETVDECVGKAVEALKEVDGQMFICADHGNAEQLIDYETGAPWTAHTTNPVPFILVNADPKYTLRENGCLADIVPTLIQLMGMEQPAEMTGKSLLVEK